MDLKSKILALLRKGQEYVSGQDLCEAFGVSRTAVWKAVNQLKEDGYEIEAVKNKGYKLMSYPDTLKKSEILSRLRTDYMGKNLYYFDQTGSTNADIKRLAEENAPQGTMALADMQVDGRGRRGRSWSSPKGTAIYFSLLLRPAVTPNQAPMITLLMALAVAKAIEETCGLEAKIKWPNDVIVNGKKVCGILTEMSLETDFIHFVVIGTGINVNQESFLEELKDRATSLYLEKGRKVIRAELLEQVLLHFESYYNTFLEEKSLGFLMEEYNSLLVSVGQEVQILDPQNTYTAVSKGINDKGELLVTCSDKTEKAIYAGEVSVRGIYGYV